MPAAPSVARSWGLSDGTAIGACGVAIIASRIPAILSDYELNVDESQMIAQVRRYWVDPLPWRSVNGDTGGPFNTWYLLLANRLGVPLEYAWIHALAAVTLAATVVLSAVAARRLFGSRAAVAGGILGTLWVCLHQISDFVQYASELVPIFLVSLALVLAGTTFAGDLVAALLLGLMPWAKLQGVPIGAAIGAWILARTLWPVSREGSMKGRVAQTLAIALAAALPTLVMVAAVVHGGAWEECRRAYFVTNLAYAGEAKLLPFLRRVFYCTVSGSTVAPWCVGLVVAGVVVPWRRELGRRFTHWRSPSALAAAIVLASIYAWARTPTLWAHYDFFLLPGLVVATAAVLQEEPGHPRAFRRLLVMAAVAAIAYAAALGGSALRQGKEVLEGRRRSQAADGLLSAVRTMVPQYRTLAVWGWRPSVYVRGHLTPPTRQANCGFLFIASPSRDFLRRKYADDLEAALPDVVLDTGGMSFEKFWHGIHVLEAPEVAPVIRAHYVLRAALDAEDGTAYIYTLRPR